MTAIGKLMSFLLFAAGIAMMTWSVSTYVQRPGWFEPIPEGVDKGNNPVTFKQLQAENEALNRAAAVASDTWGANLKELEEREAFRYSRLKAYAERNRWARKGNPKDLIDAANPKSGKGFYAPVVDPNIKLYDLTLDAAGKPTGAAIKGSDDQPLPGIDGLAGSTADDVKGIVELTDDIIKLRRAYDKLSIDISGADGKGGVDGALGRMNVIRASVQSELFYLSTFEVNVYETRETVLRREKQLRGRLKTLGVIDP